ncbi:MAG: N(4)-(beta-N-acetylglucosaminyl)-L-asparaginase [Sedimentisphaerales bacterium]|nr:N(4)-(beta-N-acetylglucosaminyl)-L-asparaginase [Sedimentisphaerales bacterium]
MKTSIDRRDFLYSTLLVGATGMIQTEAAAKSHASAKFKPGIIATWEHSQEAVRIAGGLLRSGALALDVVEKGVNVTENDPEVTSVGYGGLPDENGLVTLDACIMDGKRHRAGAVANLQNIKNPVSVARKVMEVTKHVLLTGDGALQFARKMGFPEENLLTESAREKWLQWRRNLNKDDNWLNETHDTITMLCVDQNSDIAGACTTSGLAWKVHGRVGDSPIIGAGLYVDNEVGAAGATGVGELVMQTLTSFTIVEFMRQGLAPHEACRAAFERMCDKIPSARTTQEAFIAIDKKGQVGCATNSDNFVFYYSDGDSPQRNKPTPIT